MFVGLDIGGTKTAVRIVDHAGQTLADFVQPTVLDDLVGGIIDAIRAALAAVVQPSSKVLGIGIGVPGMVDRAAGTIELATNLRVAQSVAVGGVLSAEFSTPVSLENDVRLAALGAYQQHDCPNFAYLNIGTGIAAGIILNQQLYRGSNNMAGEVGHMIVADDGTILEQQIAGPAIVQKASAAGLHVTHAGHLYDLAAAENIAAQAVVTEVSHHCARALQWLFVVYDVDHIVIGGGVTHAGSAFLTPVLHALSQMREQAALTKVLVHDHKISLLPASINAGLVGAVALARSLSA